MTSVEAVNKAEMPSDRRILFGLRDFHIQVSTCFHFPSERHCFTSFCFTEVMNNYTVGERERDDERERQTERQVLRLDIYGFFLIKCNKNRNK